ncbi:MAG TPA: methyltransferase, partial [Gemmataceae bacterium]|nr:methyltransferase [Gemmataceae bacterium]
MLVLKALVWVVIVLVHGTVTVLAPYLLLRANIELFSGGLAVLRWSGLPPVFVGVLILLWSGWHLTLAGEGTPAPFDPPKRLVAKGLYRVVRNPIYVGDLLVLAGEALLFESMILLVYAVLLFCVFHLFVVFHEEPALRR